MTVSRQSGRLVNDRKSCCCAGVRRVKLVAVPLWRVVLSITWRAKIRPGPS